MTNPNPMPGPMPGPMPAAPVAEPQTMSIAGITALIERVAGQSAAAKGDATEAAVIAAIGSVITMIEAKSKGNKQIADCLAVVRKAAGLPDKTA